jgi:hypothetical protein
MSPSPFHGSAETNSRQSNHSVSKQIKGAGKMASAALSQELSNLRWNGHDYGKHRPI